MPTNPFAFAFAFSAADIDLDPDDEDRPPAAAADAPGAMSAAVESAAAVAAALLEPRAHGLGELLATLPPSLTYTTLTLTPPPPPSPASAAHPITIPRRDLVDIRLQLMAEDPLSPDSGSESATLLAGLGGDDIGPGVYEGGLKSWECSLDLVGVLAGERGGERAVLELGCGTALPTLYLFQQALRSAPTTPTHFTLADYNPSVLRLVTLPNLLLSWAMLTSPPSEPWPPSSTLSLTPALLESFTASLSAQNITLSFLSGAWSPALTNLLAAQNNRRPPDLILASETIYSPLSLRAFAGTLVDVLRGEGGRALIAAKMVYFGVGGGVREFLRVLREEDGAGVVGEEKVVFEGGEGNGDGGVKRVVVELRGR
ncbi:MAG: hypothetical protein M1839_005466 [Geoglossum umbratile]|nr:MAG: hypothetical protein M1839_005466 [Geoglossum umbratile]